LGISPFSGPLEFYLKFAKTGDDDIFSTGQGLFDNLKQTFNNFFSTSPTQGDTVHLRKQEFLRALAPVLKTDLMHHTIYNISLGQRHL